MNDPARVFVFLGAYPGEAAAEADQQTVKGLHSSDLVGRFETTVITKDEHGHVDVAKGESNARRWAAGGLVVGATIGVMFPPSVLLMGGAGAVLGGFGAKNSGLELKAIPTADLEALGQLIHPGEAALVVVGEGSALRAIEAARLNPIRRSVKTGTRTYAELEQEVLSALDASNPDPSPT